MDTTAVIVEQKFKASSSKIWKALTDIDEMHQWYFSEIKEFRPEVGFETDFTIYNDGRSFHHLWKVLEVIPEKLISYSWKFSEYSGEGKVSFRISDQGDFRVLSVTNEGLESFPQDIPEFQRESCIGGWNYFIKESLKEYLDT